LFVTVIWVVWKPHRFTFCLMIELWSPLDKLHDNWFVNLCDFEIPQKVKLLLQLGEKFGFSLREQDKNKIIIEFVKHIEKSIFKDHEQIKSSIKGQTISILNRLLGFSPKIDSNNL